MTDPRYELLAQNLLKHSVELKNGDRILIDVSDVPDDFVISILRVARKMGGIPLLNLQHNRLVREMALGATEAQYELISQLEFQRMKNVEVFLAVRGSNNVAETSDVPRARMRMVAAKMRPVQEYRVNKTRWCVLRWPTSSMAQQANMSTEAFADFFFQVCGMDYSRMKPGMTALQKLMEKTDRVEIKGPGTDLRFSIKGIGAVACGGKHNIPDGEVFSCPVKDSVEGEITFNAPTIYQGVSFDGVFLRFEKGRIVEARANNSKRLNEILNSDEGARYIGEFALGFNPYIKEPMRDILFDEKIAGSFHFTPGQAYEIAGNGNRSQVHWDLVNIQRPEYGGGEVWFDGKLIRKNGLFVPASIAKLNPEHLLGKAGKK
ncbi:MAG: aminopeptidase [Verrucomicrobiales bacterium]